MRLQVATRPGRLLATVHPYLSAILAYAITFYSFSYGLPAVTLDALSSIAFVYNTVVFGFTVASIALAIAIPSEEFLSFLSDETSDPYRDLVFVFSWTGVVHWCGFFMAVAALFIFGKDAPINQSHGFAVSGLYFFALLSVELYCMFQFLVTIIATFEIADLYGLWMRVEVKKRKDKAAAKQVREEAANLGSNIGRR